MPVVVCLDQCQMVQRYAPPINSSIRNLAACCLWHRSCASVFQIKTDDVPSLGSKWKVRRSGAAMMAQSVAVQVPPSLTSLFSSITVDTTWLACTLRVGMMERTKVEGHGITTAAMRLRYRRSVSYVAPIASHLYMPHCQAVKVISMVRQ